jgi:hypothetical protein
MKFELKLHTNRLSDEEILVDIQLVAKSLNKNTISMSEYKQSGKYDPRNIQKRFRNWNNALQEAGLETGLTMNLSEQELFKNLENVWVSLGRQPTRREMVKPHSSISSSPYIRAFGNWNNALSAFIEYINQVDEGAQEEVHDEVSTQNQVVVEKVVKRTKREISDRLRFRILLRDGFTCAKCGRSPMKEKGVELHVDHILPWSKGGETLPENLETKCAKCNLGKGNAFEV